MFRKRRHKSHHSVSSMSTPISAALYSILRDSGIGPQASDTSSTLFEIPVTFSTETHLSRTSEKTSENELMVPLLPHKTSLTERSFLPNPLKLLHTKSKLDEAHSGPLVVDLKFEVEGDFRLLHLLFLRNHDRLHRALGDEHQKIAISVYKNLAVFLPTTTVTEAGGQRLNRSFAANLSLDDELQAYEGRSRTVGSSTSGEPSEEENIATETDNDVPYNIAIVVSIPGVSKSDTNDSSDSQPVTPVVTVPSLLLDSYVSGDSGSDTWYETDVDLSSLHISLDTICRIMWNELELPMAQFGTNITPEEFCVGLASLTLDVTRDYNFYIPDKFGSSESQVVTGLAKSQPLMRVKLRLLDEVRNGPYFSKEEEMSRLLSEHNDFLGPEPKNTFKYTPGDYVFIIPFVFNSALPETVNAPHASLSYDLNLYLRRYKKEHPHEAHGLKRLSKLFSSDDAEDDCLLVESIEDKDTHLHLVNKSVKVPLVRAPPADRPLFVDKTWNEDLAYQIVLPTKYIRLNSEVSLLVTLTPTSKHISLKSLRVNVLEKVQYVTKDLKHDFEEGRINEKDQNGRERVIPLAEVRTTSEGAPAIREDIIKLAGAKPGTRLKNLLELCFEREKTDKESQNVLLDRSLNVQIPLFFKGVSHKKEIFGDKPSELPSSPSSPRRRAFSSIRMSGRPTDPLPDDYSMLGKTQEELQAEAHQSRTRVWYGESSLVNVNRYLPISSDGQGVDFHLRKFAIPALHCDSTRFNYVSISHRIQICFRIAKPTGEKLKLHNYEVIIDAPVLVVSDMCDSDTTELPPYEGDRLPSFKEATLPVRFEESTRSVMGSPIMMAEGLDGVIEDLGELGLDGGQVMGLYEGIEGRLMDLLMGLPRYEDIK